MRKSTTTTSSPVNNEESSAEKKKVVIVGGGIGGLVLALALNKHCNDNNNNSLLEIEVYEQSSAYKDGVGGAIGMYCNGLRVIKDISEELFETIRSLGYPYLYRRWYRHDGTEVACANENLLTPSKSDDDEFISIGIRRWKLQKALYEYCIKQGIPVYFNKRVNSVESITEDGDEKKKQVQIKFANKNDSDNDDIVIADYVFGADGVKSKVRNCVLGSENHNENPEYTGVTCLMGASPTSRSIRGICFPSSQTSQCHMCIYPTSSKETIFQIYFPTPIENPEEWGSLSEEESQKEINELANRFVKDGWNDEQFVKPIKNAIPSSLVRVGLRARDPVSKWINDDSNMILLGDAAHPPVPYLGQGAMMAIEDAGTIALLLKYYCCNNNNGDDKDENNDNTDEKDTATTTKTDDDDALSFNKENVKRAMNIYESIRIPRTHGILLASHKLGETQQRRSLSRMYNIYRESIIKFDVATKGTLPTLIPGATYDYKKELYDIITTLDDDDSDDDE